MTPLIRFSLLLKSNGCLLVLVRLSDTDDIMPVYKFYILFNKKVMHEGCCILVFPLSSDDYSHLMRRDNYDHTFPMFFLLMRKTLQKKSPRKLSQLGIEHVYVDVYLWFFFRINY